MKKIKIDIIGTYPPPIGGTSIHIKRLLNSCKNADIDATVYDTHSIHKKNIVNDENVKPIGNYKKFLIKYMFNRRADIIHSHSHSWIERLILTIKAKICFQKIIFTFHSFRDELEDIDIKNRFAYKFVFIFADKIISTSNEVKDKLIYWGCNKKKITTIIPFIPEALDSTNDLNMEIEKFINKFDYIISANASNNDMYLGEDLYGLDMCIELQNELSKKFNVGFIYVLTKITDEYNLEKMKNVIEKYKLNKSFYLYIGNVDFLSVLKNSSVFVRPTNTDSWPMSVSESIMLGTPCVVSNICKRQEGSILFESRNFCDFISKVDCCLVNIDKERKKIKNIKVKNGFEDVFMIYKKLMKI